MPGSGGRAGPLGGQVAIVTGASSGIGAATASELGAAGAAVVLAARRAGALEAQAAAIRQAGGTATAMPADVSQPDHVSLLARRTLAQFGHVDILVNSAGAGWMRPLAVSPPDAIVGLVEVNLLGAMLLTRAVLPAMLARRHGAIISVGSLSGRVAMEPLYSATKFGLRGFSLALRRQLAGTGVSASLVSPGNINTAMTSHVRARMPEPFVVARQITGLIGRPRREVVLPATSQVIAWFDQALPQVADVVHHWRNWSGVAEEEPASWTS